MKYNSGWPGRSVGHCESSVVVLLEVVNGWGAKQRINVMKVTVEVKTHHHLSESSAQNRVQSTKKTTEGWLGSIGFGSFKLVNYGVIG